MITPPIRQTYLWHIHKTIHRLTPPRLFPSGAKTAYPRDGIRQPTAPSFFVTREEHTLNGAMRALGVGERPPWYDLVRVRISAESSCGRQPVAALLTFSTGYPMTSSTLTTLKWPSHPAHSASTLSPYSTVRHQGIK